MGSNRAIPASASVPSTTMQQTPSPSGSISPPIPVLDMSCPIKTEPSAQLSVQMDTHCRSENWAESYQDLSSWCSTTLASSPAICPLPVIDETLISEIEFQGEIDFDLRKSEEIASIPVEEDCSFNLWGSGNPNIGVNTPTPQTVSAATSTLADPVLLKDCWWFKVEHDKVGKELESNRPSIVTTTTNSSIKNFPAPAAVKEEGTETKENMNPVASHPLLADPVKMAELQMRLERIASHTHPGVNSKTKAADLMKILQEQIAILNKKKHRSPAAVSDLYNDPIALQGQDIPSTSAAGTLPQYSQTRVTSSTETTSLNSNDIFYSDPFDGLFPTPDIQTHHVQHSVEPHRLPVNSSTQSFQQNIVVSPAFISSSNHSSTTDAIPHPNVGGVAHRDHRGKDLFTEAHNEIMKEATKTRPSNPSPQNSEEQPLAHTNSQHHRMSTVKNETGLTIQLPTPRMSELDINFDNLLFGSPGSFTGMNKTPAINTPEVLKPLVETPDPESFDLLSYLCDDKMNTPPVYLDSNNPFQFPQPSSTLTTTATTTVTEHKTNVMIVKPLTPEWSKNIEKVAGSEKDDGKESAVVVLVQPQIMPPTANLMDVSNATLSDVEEEEEEYHQGKQDSKVDLKKNAVELVKEELNSARPLRSPRKRKYSDDFVFSPSPSEESSKSSRRRRTTSSKYDSDEEFTLPVRKARKRSAASFVEEEDGSKKKRPRGASVAKRGERTVSTSSESDRYRELRDRNNEASRKSRLTRKAREQELGKQAETLTRENRVLKVKVEEMENLVKKLREALLQSMMKKT